MKALGEPFKKQAAMEVPLVLPATFAQPLQQGMTTMQFAPTVIPTGEILCYRIKLVHNASSVESSKTLLIKDVNVVIASSHYYLMLAHLFYTSE